MICYLHVGPGKTGTTTIQHFLHHNRKELLKQKYAYTTSVGIHNNFLLAACCWKYDDSKKDHFNKHLGVKNFRRFNKFQNYTINSLKKESETLHKKGINNIIFSSEHLANLELPYETDRLKDILHLIGMTEIKVIIYLRAQYETISSLYSTIIKSGNSVSIPKANDQSWSANFDHKQALQKWADVFGENQLIPRIYDRSELINRSIISDFLYCIQLKKTDEFTIPIEENNRLTDADVNILFRINQKLPRYRGSSSNPDRYGIEKYFNFNKAGVKYQVPPYVLNEYRNTFNNGNEWVRQKWFPERKTLFIVKDNSRYEYELEKKLHEKDYEDIAEIIYSLWSNADKIAIDRIYANLKYYIKKLPLFFFWYQIKNLFRSKHIC